MSRKRGLGRGLGALLGDNERVPASDARSAAGHADADGGPLREVPVVDIRRGQYQPRRHFDEEALAELAASIRAQGVMQPVVVRPLTAGGYELIAGERRWRAAQMAGLETIPAVIRAAGDEDALALSLIENIQREDLGPLEEAQALARLQQEFGLTQQQVADAVGKSRVAVTNLLRLLNLTAPVRAMLESGDLEMGHARALLSLPPDRQLAVAREVVARSLTVRDTERRVRELLRPSGTQRPAPPPAQPRDPDTARLERELGDRIGAPVRIRHEATGKGELVIRYASLDELQGILAHLR